MKASELICELQKGIAHFGDLEVRFQDVERNPNSCPIGGVWLADHNQTFLIDSYMPVDDEDEDEDDDE